MLISSHLFPICVYGKVYPCFYLQGFYFYTNMNMCGSHYLQQEKQLKNSWVESLLIFLWSRWRASYLSSHALIQKSTQGSMWLSWFPAPRTVCEIQVQFRPREAAPWPWGISCQRKPGVQGYQSRNLKQISGLVNTVVPEYSRGIGSRAARGYQYPQLLKFLTQDGVLFVYNLHTSSRTL